MARGAYDEPRGMWPHHTPLDAATWHVTCYHLGIYIAICFARWDSSICLFHTMLGGSPVPAQFLNTRPRSKYPWPTARRRIESEAIGVDTPPVASRSKAQVGVVDHDPILLQDEWDEALYRAAVARFDSDMAQRKTHAREQKPVRR